MRQVLQSATIITKCDSTFRHWIRQFFLETGLPPYLEAAYSVSGDKEQEKFHSEFMTTGGKLLFSFAG